MVTALVPDGALRPAVFLDRDGVLIEEVGLLTGAAHVRLTAGAPRAVAGLQHRGYAIAVVTNQTVVARGMCTEDDVRVVHERIDELLVDGGAQPVEAWQACFHHPHATVDRYRRECACRKPLPGLLLDAAAALRLDLGRSFMVGDRLSDIVAGWRAGCTTILVESGAHREPAIESAHHDPSVRPDAVCADLAAAAQWILRNAA